MSPGKPPTTNRKKGTACVRCRTQKIRCDDTQPACKNCNKSGQPCVRLGHAADQETVGYIHQLEARIWLLEDALRRAAPQQDAVGVIATPAPTNVNTEPVIGPQDSPNPTNSLLGPRPWTSESPSTYDPRVLDASQQEQRTHHGETTTPGSTAASTSQIKPSEPLAHEVGLLSLASTNEPKYLGPSSGVPFARLILSAIPQSQGLPTSLATPGGGSSAAHHPRPEPFPQDWVFDADLKHFVGAYFDTYQPLYPFLDEDTILTRLNNAFSQQPFDTHAPRMPRLADFTKSLSPVHCGQILLVIAIGARTLEPRLSVDFSSERYLATAMAGIDNILLHDTMDGLQIMLLLTLCSLCFIDGPNAWFLTSNIIAACLDLGLQRKLVEVPANRHIQGESLQTHKNVRRGIFWSAYSLERTLAVVLGRPLTLRDEATDIEFPGAEDFEDRAQADGPQSAPGNLTKKRRMFDSPYTTAYYGFRLDQLAAEMKLMMYRVVNKPGYFPWLPVTAEWQKDAHGRCERLLEEMLRDLKWRSRGVADGTLQHLEIKYHQCVMLLHRPSPATPRPGLESWKICYASAVKTVLIAAELNRFSKLDNSWLMAHNIFISGITFLYCLWTKPEIKKEASLQSLESHTSACISLLKFLGKTWSVAADALTRFDRLAQMTISAWKSSLNEPSSDEVAASQSLLNMQRPPDMPASPSAQITGSLDFLGAENNDDAINSQFFYNELEDISGWFDLDWMINTERGELTAYD